MTNKCSSVMMSSNARPLAYFALSTAVENEKTRKLCVLEFRVNHTFKRVLQAAAR